MRKRGFSILACVMTGLLFLIGGLSSAFAQSNIVYSLATDTELQSKAVGYSFEGTTWFVRSGAPGLTLVDNGGVKAIRVYARNVDWDCIDLKNLATLPAGGDYTIKVTGRSVEGAKMKLSQPTGPYGTHVSMVVGADKTFTLEKTFTSAELQKEKAVRIQSEASMGEFTIMTITVTGTAAAASQAAAPAPAVVAPPSMKVDGIFVYDMSRGDAWSGANIILGNNASQWPWSTADADGRIAFFPVKDATYRITINYTSTGTAAIRVRWVKDNTNGSYTKGDAAVVNNYPYAQNQVAVTIPAYFNSGMENGKTYTLVTEIKLDGTQAADGLIGNIAIRGGGGGNAFSINSIKVEKIGTGGAADKLLSNWLK
jgi:hypothetical protein